MARRRRKQASRGRLLRLAALMVIGLAVPVAIMVWLRRQPALGQPETAPELPPEMPPTSPEPGPNA